MILTPSGLQATFAMQLPREDSQPLIFSLFGDSITTPPDPDHFIYVLYTVY